MPHYLIQVSYTSDAWAAMVKHPQNRVEVVRPVIEGMGGSLGAAFLCFGDYDVVVIAEMPNNINAAAFAMAVSAGGATRTVKTTPLMTVDEGVEAMIKAGESRYRPPS